MENDIPQLPVIPARLVKEHNLKLGPLTIVNDSKKFETNEIVMRNIEKLTNKNKDAISAGLLAPNKKLNQASKLNRFKKWLSAENNDIIRQPMPPNT